MNSLDPKLTLAVYIGGALIFIAFLATIFIYTKRMNLRKAAMNDKGRPPVTKEEGIAIATERRGKS